MTDKEYHQKKINEALKIFRESHLTCASDGRSYDYDGNYNMGDIIIINVIAKLLERIEKSEWNNPKEKLPTKDCEVLIEYDEHKTYRVVDWNNKSQRFGGFSIDEVKRWKEIE